MSAGRRRGSVGLDARLANDAAIYIVLLANVGTVVRAARTDWIESQNVKLFPDLGYLQCRREPVSELGDSFFRGLRRRDDTKPRVYLVVFVTGLCHGRHLWKRRDPCPRGGGENV